MARSTNLRLLLGWRCRFFKHPKIYQRNIHRIARVNIFYAACFLCSSKTIRMFRFRQTFWDSSSRKCGTSQLARNRRHSWLVCWRRVSVGRRVEVDFNFTPPISQHPLCATHTEWQSNAVVCVFISEAVEYGQAVVECYKTRGTLEVSFQTAAAALGQRLLEVKHPTPVVNFHYATLNHCGLCV